MIAPISGLSIYPQQVDNQQQQAAQATHALKQALAFEIVRSPEVREQILRDVANGLKMDQAFIAKYPNYKGNYTGLQTNLGLYGDDPNRYLRVEEVVVDLPTGEKIRVKASELSQSYEYYAYQNSSANALDKAQPKDEGQGRLEYDKDGKLKKLTMEWTSEKDQTAAKWDITRSDLPAGTARQVSVSVREQKQVQTSSN